MSYSIIQPLFTLKFREKSAAELNGYREWFLGGISVRIAELESAIHASPNWREWNCDNSVASVEDLGQWLYGQVQTRSRTTEEVERMRAQTVFDFGITEDELTNTTFSLAMDAGIYLGETIRYQNPHLEWYQPLSDKKFADFGQMVLRGFGQQVLNPVRICVTFCYGVANGKRTEKTLGELYQYWCRLAESSQSNSKRPGEGAKRTPTIKRKSRGPLRADWRKPQSRGSLGGMIACGITAELG